ncbi:DUF5960 family protein [Enterococcus pallens]|uniref:Uncharacterized protein n=1 Tax=Enterococcus pallens ATCC BAA-351 TaxID=1158607 RepID=R2SHV7_9ENTE|nr:DUF5960 family protein [Enterococcus pallens]EOH94860.1 hypothetical protein UAU_01782 [Enterococcus pallens ATCC BAA-351]EOU14821.1 hypothetical protein I588_04471 [Enterococcus pallens ATCC BAA-351]OJG71638.1 hypothetical protein RV10_GL004923 [Enterococcus pallens]
MLQINNELDFETGKKFCEDFEKYNILNEGLLPAFSIIEDIIFLMESQKIEYFIYPAINNSFNKDMRFSFKKANKKFFYQGFSFVK